MRKKFKRISLTIVFLFLFESYSINTYSSILNYKKINYQLIQLKHIAKAHSQCLTQLQNQLLKIEQEVDYLRGQVQENEHKLLEIVKQQNNIVKKIDLIIKKDLNTDKKNIIPSFKTINDNLLPSSSINKNVDNHFNAYNKAVNLVLEKKQYENAIQTFQEFILKYPHSSYQSNAHYWLGQLNYRKGNKNEASYYFALVAKNYPKSQKAADALLKVGIIMEESGHKEKAKLIYKEVCHLYSNTDSAKHSLKRLKNY